MSRDYDRPAADRILEFMPTEDQADKIIGLLEEIRDLLKESRGMN